MAKTYMKDQLTYKSGLLFNKDGEIVCVDSTIIDAFNKLETDAQRGLFSTKRNELMENVGDVMSIEFKRESARPTIDFEVKTEHLDKAIEEACAIMDDIDAERKGDDVRDYLDLMSVLVQFVADDFVIDVGGPVYRFDLPLIGNPLEVDEEDLVHLAEMAVS